jgi:hypothetical protein
MGYLLVVACGQWGTSPMGATVCDHHAGHHTTPVAIWLPIVQQSPLLEVHTHVSSSCSGATAQRSQCPA